MTLKRLIIGIIALLVCVILILVIKTYTYPFKTSNKEKNVAVVIPKPSNKSIKRFIGGIRIPTISNAIYEDTNFEPFKEFMAYLPKVYPNIYNVMSVDTINNYSLVFHWKGKNSNLKPVLFLSHYDVVPVVGYDSTTTFATDTLFRPNDTPIDPINKVAESWDYSPFSGAVVNGRIYGRGTLDMKNMLFSILESADALIEENFQPERDIWIAFGHDEEVSGRQGALKIASYFKNKGLTFEAVYDEGGIVASAGSAMQAIQKPLALVGVGEKGFLTLKITVRGLGGHSSMPPAKGSLVYAAEIIEKLNSKQFEATIIPPISEFLNNIGGEMGFTSKLAIANQWLLKPILLKTLEKSPASNALIRTTTAITMAKSSDAPNVLSSTSEITVNFRILPNNTVAQVMEHVNNICKDYNTQVEIISEREPSSISPTNAIGFKNIKDKINSLYPNAIVSSYITIGGTDAYKYQIVSNHIYRFIPVLLNAFEQRTIHNENEYISLDNYGRMLWYFKEMMKSY